MSTNHLKLNADNTELLWAGSKYGFASFGSNRPSLQLGAKTVTASKHVHLLGVTMSFDLSVDKHVTTVSWQWKLLLASSAEESPTFIR